MVTSSRRFFILAIALFGIALILLATPAFAESGDYGVKTGSSGCGGRGQPACSVTHGGYTATFRTISGGYAVYSFSFSCELLLDVNLNTTVTGSECSQYLSSSSR